MAVFERRHACVPVSKAALGKPELYPQLWAA